MGGPKDGPDRRTQLSYLDLGAIYLGAEKTRKAYANEASSTPFFNNALRIVREQADTIMGLIIALRYDGLDPHWHPERDALAGIWTSGTDDHGKNVCQIDDGGAGRIIHGLRERGYKIVKDAP